MRNPNKLARSILLVATTACLLPATAGGHGLMLDPLCRAAGDPQEDYQYCFGTPGCECGAFPEAGDVVATYEAGQSIQVTIQITQSHAPDPTFRFQLCPPDQLSPECFVEGEFAMVPFDQTTGTRTYDITLPDDLVCDPCVLRWKWDYGFLSCSDVRIVSNKVELEAPMAWAALKARYQ